MEHNFWLDRWQTNQIGFHLADANPLLVKHFSSLQLAKGARVFIPLCGKTLDIAWLLSQGYRVAGAELVEMAIVQLFNDLGVSPSITTVGELKRYSAHNIDIFVGDIFELTADMLGAVDASYDRAALVALPSEMRVRYTTHIKTITQHAPELLITFEYDQALVPGPPFSVNAAEVKTHYDNATLLESNDLPQGMKGLYPAKEATWLVGCAPRR
jgi:thiopurine S-methyltransferase